MEKELSDDDCDREFLLDGIKNGFHIVSSSDFAMVECENYNSAMGPSVFSAVETQINTEIVEGRYI